MALENLLGSPFDSDPELPPGTTPVNPSLVSERLQRKNLAPLTAGWPAPLPPSPSVNETPSPRTRATPALDFGAGDEIVRPTARPAAKAMDFGADDEVVGGAPVSAAASAEAPAPSSFGLSDALLGAASIAFPPLAAARGARELARGTEIEKGFTGGLIGTNPKLMGDAAEGLGVLTDNQTLVDTGKKIAGFGQEQLDQYKARVPSWTDIRTDSLGNFLSDFGSYAGYSTGQGLATSAPSLVAGGLATYFTANPFIGIAIGAVGPSYIQNYGDVYGSAKEDKDIAARVANGELTPKELAASAAVAAVPMAALDVLGLETVLGKTVFAEARRDLLRRVVKGIAIGAVTEGTTEGLQEVISQWAQHYLGSQTPLKDKLIAVIDNAFGGMFAGGAMGGAGAAGQRHAGTAPASQPAPTPLEGEVLPPEQSGVPPSAPSAPSAPIIESEATEVAPVPALPAPAEVSPPAPRQNTPSPEGILSMQPDDRAILRAYGYTDQQIQAMTPAQRQAEVADATEAGVKPQPVPEGVLPQGAFGEGDAVVGSRAAPVTAETPANLERVAPVVNAEPTEAQKQAGNYRMGHVRYDGLDVTIENPKGSTRSGTDADGKPWSSIMPGHYGYVKRTAGADGDQVDVLIGGAPTGKVFVVDQNDLKTGAYDEHKVMLGVSTEAEARKLYESAYYDGRGAERIGAVTPMSIKEFKGWLKNGDTRKPVGAPAAHPEVVDAMRTVLDEGLISRAAFDEIYGQGAADAVHPAAAPTHGEDHQRPGPERAGPSEAPQAAPDRGHVPEGGQPVATFGEADHVVEPGPAHQGNEPAASTAEGAGRAEGLTFRTAKGSTYVVHEDGTTTRTKAARADIGHEGDSGIKTRSEKTVYVDNPKVASALSAAGLENLGPKGARVVIKDGKASLLTWNKKANQWGRAAHSTDIPVSDTPAVGKAPLELWKKASDVPAGWEGYRGMHAGNAITEMGGPTAPEQSALPDGFKISTRTRQVKGGGTEEAFALYEGKKYRGVYKTREEAVAAAKPQATSVPRKPTQRGPLSLFEFLAANGGIRDHGGELRAMGLHRTLVPGFGPLVRPNGKPLDRAREAAVEAGYLRDTPWEGGVNKTTIPDLLNLLDQQHRGQKVYAEGDQPEVIQRQADREAKESVQSLKKAETNVRAVVKAEGFNATDAEIAQASRIVAEQNLDPLDTLVGILEQNAFAFENELTDNERSREVAHGRENAATGTDEAGATAAQAVEPAEPERAATTERAPARNEPREDQRDRGAAATREPTERTPAGEQHVLPGAGRIGQGEQAQRKADQPLKPKVAQKPADQGLFSDESKQTDLVDMARAGPPKSVERLWYQGVPAEGVGKPQKSEYWTTKLGAARDYAGSGGYVHVAKESDLPPGMVERADRGRSDSLIPGAPGEPAKLRQVPTIATLPRDAPDNAFSASASRPTKPQQAPSPGPSDSGKALKQSVKGEGEALTEHRPVIETMGGKEEAQYSLQRPTMKPQDMPDPMAAAALEAIIKALGEPVTESEMEAARQKDMPVLVDPKAEHWDLYHGTGSRDFDKFDPEFDPRRPENFPGPVYERAIFFSPSPENADRHASFAGNARIIRVRVNPGKTRVFDLHKLIEDPKFVDAMRERSRELGRPDGEVDEMLDREFERKRYHESFFDEIRAAGAEPNPWQVPYGLGMVDTAIEIARKEGLDTAIIRGMNENNGGDEVAVINPGRVFGAYSGKLLYSIRSRDLTPAVKTAEFKRWFSGSKVVDADGRPLVVYHGTTKAFDAFNTSRLGASTRHPSSKLGFFFSASPDVGSLFTQALDDTVWPPKIVQREGANVVPAYLAINKPFELSVEQFRDINARPYGEDFEREQPEAAKRVADWIEKNKALIIARGHDGIHIKGDPKYAERMGGEEYAADAWVAFKPEQIKSATGNRGTFDPSDARMAYSVRDNLTPAARQRRADIERMLSQVVRMLTGRNASIQFADKIPFVASKGWGSQAEASPTAAGLYDPARALITLALADPAYPGSPMTTAFHEAFHAIEHQLLTDKEMELFKRETPRLREWINKNLDWSPVEGKKAAAGWADDIADYEVRAIAFETYAMARGEGKPINGFHIGIARLFSRLLLFLERIRNALRGLGFKTTEDIFSDVYEGKMAGRTPERGPNAEARASIFRREGEPSLYQTIRQKLAALLGGPESNPAGAIPLVRPFKLKTISGEPPTAANVNLAPGQVKWIFNEPGRGLFSGEPNTPYDAAVRRSAVLSVRERKKLEAEQRAIIDKGLAEKREEFTKEEVAHLAAIDAKLHAGAPEKQPTFWFVTDDQGHTLADIYASWHWDKSKGYGHHSYRGTLWKPSGPGTITPANHSPEFGTLKAAQQWAEAYLAVGRQLGDVYPRDLPRRVTDAWSADTKKFVQDFKAKNRKEPDLATILMHEAEPQVRAEEARRRRENLDAIEGEGPQYALRRAAPATATALTMPHETVRAALRDPALSTRERLSAALDALTLTPSRALWDKLIDVSRLQRAAELANEEATAENLDTYLAATLYPGRAGERLKDASHKLFRPIYDAMKAHNITRDELHDYLYARHAAERNEQIRQIDPANDAGSGMTDEDAQTILDNASARQADYDAVAALADAVVAHNRQLMEREGLESAETLERWQEAYQHYVPLKGAEASESEQHGTPPTGKGFDVRRPESRRALGRFSRSDDILTNLLDQTQRTIIRAEKNRVGKTFLRFAQANPSPLYKIGLAEQRRRINRETGLVERIWVTTSADRDSVFGVKIGGETYYVDIRHEGLATALKNLGMDRLNPFMRVIAAFTRQYSAFQTARNPEFVLTNLMRDLQDAGFSLNAEQQKGFKRAFVKHLLKGDALMAAVLGTARDGQESNRHPAFNEYIRLYNEWRQAGGKISTFGYKDLESIRRDIEKELSRRTESKAKTIVLAAPRLVNPFGGNIVKLFEALSDITESTTRLAVYAAAKDIGLSKAESARAARSMTVDFNAKGKYSPAMQALYAFSNPALQGQVNLVRRLRRSRKMQAAAGSVAMLGFMLTLWNLWASPWDEKDKKRGYEKRQYWEREKNILIYLPGHPDALKIPMGYALAPFFMMGENAAMAVMGKIKPLEALGNWLGTTAKAFNPIGGEGSVFSWSFWMGALSPTITDPVFELGRNRNWLDRQIHPEEMPWTRGKPHSEQSKVTTSPIATDLAQWMNRVSGGNHFLKGKVDAYPDDLEYIWNFALGGYGKFMLNNYGMVSDKIAGVDTPVERIPFVRRFIAPGKSDQMERTQYYEASHEAGERASTLRDAVKAEKLGQNVEEARRAIDELAPKVGQSAGPRGGLRIQSEIIFRDANKEIQELRLRERNLRRDDTLSRAERSTAIEENRARQVEIMQSARRAYRDMQPAQ